AARERSPSSPGNIAPALRGQQLALGGHHLQLCCLQEWERPIDRGEHIGEFQEVGGTRRFCWRRPRQEQGQNGREQPVTQVYRCNHRNLTSLMTWMGPSTAVGLVAKAGNR